MAIEDLEPLTKREEKNGGEAEIEVKEPGDSLNALLTTALHKHTAKKLAKRVGKKKKADTSSEIRIQREAEITKEKNRLKEEQPKENLELKEITNVKVKRKTSRSKESPHESEENEAKELKKREVLEKECFENDSVPKEDALSTEVAIDSPTRDYLKAVSVPKKKTERKSRSCIKETGKILGITIHCADRLEGSPLLLPHPAVQVHICNADTGEYLQKTSPDRKVTSYYEGNNVDHILPIMTQPYDLQKARSLNCRWEEQLIFNEPIEHFSSSEPQVIIFFQLMDFPPSSSNSSNVLTSHTQSSSSKGWATFAWAFLKVHGTNNHINIGQRLRVQLWRPRKASNVNLKDIHSWWKSGSRTKYPCTIYVSLQEINVPQQPRPALRSMIFTQQEQGGGPVLMDLLDQSSTNESVQGLSSLQNDPEISWSRKPNQSCKVPNHIRHCLSYTDQGCLVVKFSNCGLKLACGAYKQILIYDVLSGQLELSLNGHLGLVYDVSWSDKDELLLTASADSTARVWNTKSQDKCRQPQILAHPSYVYAARFVPSRHQIVVTGCFDHVLRVWCSSKTGNYMIVQELTSHLGFINSLCFSKQGDVLYSGDKQGVILTWKIDIPKKEKAKKKVKPLTLEREVKISDIVGNTINFISVHPGGYRLLVHTRDSQIRLVNHVHWTVTHRLRGLLNVREQIRGCVSPCGTWVLSGSEDHCIYVWNTDTGEMLSAFTDLPIDGTISCVDYHPHEHMIAVCSYSNEAPVLILDFNEAQQVANTTVPLTVQPTGSLTAPTTLLRSPSPSFSIRKLTPMPKNSTISSMDKSTSFGKHSDTAYNIRPSEAVYFPNDQTYNNTSISVDWKSHKDWDTDNMPTGKHLWKDQGTKILKKLDTVLKMATENPVGLNDSILNPVDELMPLGQLATLLYDYYSKEPDELSVKQGDYVIVVQETNNDWWLVRSADQRFTGLVPSTYLQKLPGRLKDYEDIDWIDSGNVIAVQSGSGEVSFISDSEGTPSKARARRHKAKASVVKTKKITSTPKNT